MNAIRLSRTSFWTGAAVERSSVQSPPPADIKRVLAAPKIGLVVVLLPTARWHRFMVMPATNRPPT